MCGGGAELAAAACRYDHCYCARPPRRPAPLTDRLRAAAQALVVPGQGDAG